MFDIFTNISINETLELAVELILTNDPTLNITRHRENQFHFPGCDI